MRMKRRGLSLIGVASSAGARRTGQEGAPAAYRAAGLLEKLRAKGLDVVDEGDSPSVSYRPDPEHPRQQNIGLVAQVARQTADRVERAAASGRVPLVLGGDCTVGLGVVAGLCRRHPRLGLLYFDGDVDLNTPDTTPSGIFDGMVVAHLLGRGVPDLAGLGPRIPLLSEEDVVLFGYDEESGSFDPPELEALEHSRISKYPLARVRPDPAAAARDALSYLQKGPDAFAPPLRRRRHQPLRRRRPPSARPRPRPRLRRAQSLPRLSRLRRSRRHRVQRREGQRRLRRRARGGRAGRKLLTREVPKLRRRPAVSETTHDRSEES